MSNKNVEKCYRCNGHEPCDNQEDGLYYAIAGTNICVWKGVVERDKALIREGYDNGYVTFPDIRRLME